MKKMLRACSLVLAILLVLASVMTGCGASKENSPTTISGSTTAGSYNTYSYSAIRPDLLYN